MKERLKTLLRDITRTCADWTTTHTRDERVLSTCVSEFVRSTLDLKEANNPIFIVEYVRDALAYTQCDIREIKVPQDSKNPNHLQFQGLIRALKNAPPLPGPVIQEQVELCNTYLGNHTGKGVWGDVASHFEISSSKAHKARILYTIVRLMRPSSFLEVGTAYGLSGSLLLRAAERCSGGGRLWTIEATEQQYMLASEQLCSRFADKVSCINGFSSDVLPSVINKSGRIDMVFHDGGHSKEDYINDFDAVIDYLRSGAVVLIDDIDWYDKHICDSDPECYAGWEYIAFHPRVEWAVEIGSSIGLALIK